jgi:hypothetical protein
MFVHDRTAEHGWPLFIRADDWRRQLKSWSSELLPSSAKAESDCEAWLREKFDSGTRRGQKPALRKEACAEFPKLSSRGFDRAWEKTALPEHRKPGAPAQKDRRT